MSKELSIVKAKARGEIATKGVDALKEILTASLSNPVASSLAALTVNTALFKAGFYDRPHNDTRAPYNFFTNPTLSGLFGGTAAGDPAVDEWGLIQGFILTAGTAWALSGAFNSGLASVSSLVKVLGNK